ncbi:MAG: type IV pilus twitching motility protein PilT [Terriglobia bacterium]
MATTPNPAAPPPVAAAPPAAAPPRPAQAAPVTDSVLAAMLSVSKQVSDLLFSPGRPPQVELNGELAPVKVQGLPVLTPDITAQIAVDLIGKNKTAVEKLRTEGSCDISYSLRGLSRFRVNIFQQRGTCAIVMRVIPTDIPDFDTYNLPPQLAKICDIKNGIVLVTGPTGSGKTSTLAAILNKINQQKAIHIVTIEDPIEFLHPHRKATVHQRELHSDTPTFALALRAALRQAPKVILVGEMRDKETIEIALEAAETGHLVFSTLHTIDASRTLERIVGVFPLGDQDAIRNRFAKAFRYVVSQRLMPKKGGGRVAAMEILIATLRTREYVEKGESEGKTLVDAMQDGELDGMQHFDMVIEKMIRDGVVDLDTGLGYATNPGNLRLQLGDFIGDQEAAERAAKPAVKPVAGKGGGGPQLDIER